MTAYTDPEDWLSKLVITKWGTIVDELIADGVKVPVQSPPIITGASDKASHGSVKNGTRLKIYSDIAESQARVTHGDLDRDVTATLLVDIKSQGPRARHAARSSVLVLDRLWQRSRRNPHADWHELQASSVREVTGYHDFQHHVWTIRLRRYGEVLVEPLNAPI